MGIGVEKDVATLAGSAERLRALHRGPEVLVLPNAWDAASARQVEEAGFPAVATTSSGMAACLGWTDGEKTPVDEMLAAIARVTRVVSVPVTADLEGGYGLAPEELVSAMLRAGAVGCNLEDTDRSGRGALRDPSEQAAFLAAVKAAARAAGVDVVLNARIDVFLRFSEGSVDRVREAVRRAERYLAAGVDCVFPIGVKDEADVAALVRNIAGPVNVNPPVGVSVGRLQELGVRRVSFGGRLHKLTMAEQQRQVEAVAEETRGIPP